MFLTDTVIRTAQPADKPRKLFDERGLFLLVNPNGSKLWRLKYRVDGREKLLALGAYPDVSLKQARERRDDARKHVADGRDPGAQRKEAKAKVAGADTFKAVAEVWRLRQKTIWTAGHAITVERRLKNDVFPYIGRDRIDTIEAPALLALLRRVESRGAIETAHRIKTVCGQVFAFAVASGLCTRNPAADLGSAALSPVVRKPMAALLKPAEVAALLRAIDDYSGTHVVRCAFKLAPLVFVRPGELRAAEWSEFDLDAAQWVIPAKRMKLRKAAKEDAKRSHIVPLSTQAVAILREIHELTGDACYVFPSARSDKRPMSENALTAALRRMGYAGTEMTWHGFRSIASTILNERGYNPDAIEAQLAHVPGNGVRASYNRAKYIAERTQMMQDWSDYLDALKQGSNVTPIRQGKAG